MAFIVGRVTECGEQSACARTITTAADACLTQERLDEVPTFGTSADRYELFLVHVGMIRQVPYY